MMQDQGLDDIVIKKLGLEERPCDMTAVSYTHLPITRTYVSIVPISGQQRLREVNLYNDDFKKMKTYQIDYQYDDFNNNGALMLNGCIMSATLGSLVECTPFGTVKQIIEINRTTEIEDIAYCLSLIHI